MAQKPVMQQIEKWRNLLPNQHCHFSASITGSHYWRNQQGDLHRVDENGIQDGPAYLRWDGHQEWYLDGKCHRLDGPAIVDVHGKEHWFLEDENLSREMWAARVLGSILYTLRKKRRPQT